MATYRHILITTDLSDISRLIIERANSLAKRFQAQLSIIHVINHTAHAYGGEFSIPIDINVEQQLESSAKHYLNQLAQAANIPTERQFVTNGSIKIDVCTMAKELSVDLILVGSHHRHGISSLLGSQANAILHAAPCDVLNIKINETDL